MYVALQVELQLVRDCEPAAADLVLHGVNNFFDKNAKRVVSSDGEMAAASSTRRLGGLLWHANASLPSTCLLRMTTGLGVDAARVHELLQTVAVKSSAVQVTLSNGWGGGGVDVPLETWHGQQLRRGAQIHVTEASLGASSAAHRMFVALVGQGHAAGAGGGGGGGGAVNSTHAVGDSPLSVRLVLRGPAPSWVGLAAPATTPLQEAAPQLRRRRTLRGQPQQPLEPPAPAAGAGLQEEAAAMECTLLSPLRPKGDSWWSFREITLVVPLSAAAEGAEEAAAVVTTVSARVEMQLAGCSASLAVRTLSRPVFELKEPN